MKKIVVVFFVLLSVHNFGQKQLTIIPSQSQSQSQFLLNRIEQPNFSFEKESKDSLPPVTFGKVLFEYLGGNVVCFGLSILSYGIGAGVELHVGEHPVYFSATGMLTLFLSYPFSLAYGVYLIGNIGVEEGSYWSTFWGTLAGIGVGMGVATIGSQLDDNKTLYTIAAFCPSAGAIIGFNSSRRLETDNVSFKIERNKYKILKPDFSVQLLRVNF